MATQRVSMSDVTLTEPLTEPKAIAPSVGGIIARTAG